MDRLLTVNIRTSIYVLNILIIWCFMFMPHAYGQTLTIVTNESVNQVSFSQSEIRQIFSARKQFWDDGSKITVFVLEPSSMLHKQFCKQNLNMFPYQLERLWHQITYSGQGDPPLIKKSQAAMIEAVLSTPGAIGYAEDGFVEQLSDKAREEAQ
ncbi:hypothetical protein [Alteromonas sp. ASW11-130]|uniref:hypothetical protein n=1 Tax=Alteromonas sp. ASW11-130 TaxID=3015775 RepID=UPI0022424139|nr:hypothetical protein [Alteromonas sp. ASW11-130]MCW8091176.1 hypothetical protein [Alteromonas sp. ASW11-130]